jgi:integrase
MDEIIARVIDGKVVIFARSNSKQLQCRFSVGGRQLRRSLKTEDVVEAKEKAVEEYFDAKMKVKANIPIVSKSVKSVAEAVIVNLEAKQKAGSGKPAYKTYAGIIRNHIIPFFGNKFITAIDHTLLQEFSEWRREKVGKNLSKGTIHNHITAFQRVFDLAVQKGYMTKNQVPDLINDGRAIEVRPAFTLPEYTKFIRISRWWYRKGKSKKVKEKRAVLHDLLLILVNTGIRPGTESFGLRWHHIHYQHIKGVEYIIFTVNGKSGPRDLVARHSVVRPLERLLHRQTKYSDKSLRDALAERIDAPVFAHSDGKVIDNFSKVMAELLTESGYLVDPVTKVNRTLYSMRHTYMTWELLRGTSPAIVAKHCGTSLQMIQQHYNHITSLMAAATLAGKMR